MSQTLDRLCDYVVAAAAIASNARPATIQEKAKHDFVTNMDRQLEDVLRVQLGPLFGVPVLGEESIRDDEMLPDAAVVVDPLDGTGNWIAGIPFSAVSVAYVEHGRSVMAAVAAIGTDVVYAAEAGAGATRNGERLSLAAIEPPPLIALSTGLLDTIDGTDAFRRVRAFGKLRNFGSQALQLCAVAQGALALNASIEARLWDDAAGRLIALEAGAAYRAFIPAEQAGYPAAAQRSICVHPIIAAETKIILSPFLENDRS